MPRARDPRYMDAAEAAIARMPIGDRAVHGLLSTGGECLARAFGIAKERGIDPAIIAEVAAAMALANAARAMLVAIHQSSGHIYKE